MFSILTPDIPGRMVLDLFSGNGALGLEALSRGAAFACFNDWDRTCTKVIRENLMYTGLVRQAQVTQLDFREALSGYAAERKRFGLVLLDPPYAAGFIPEVLEQVTELHLWESGCAVMCEHAREDILPEAVGVFLKEKTRAYGTVGLTLYRAGETE